MNTDYSSGNRLIIMLLQLAVIAMCLFFLFVNLHRSVLADLRAHSEFATTDCLLMSKRIGKTGTFITRYRADFLLSYNIQGIQYSRWATGNGLDDSYFHTKSESENLLKRFVVGQRYSCRYDPSNPYDILLLPRHNWYSALPMLIPVVIALIALYYFTLNLFVIFRRSNS